MSTRINEIKSQICDLRCSIEELADECWHIWQDAEDKRTESVADYLQYELTAIASHLADLEETEEEDKEGQENAWWDARTNEQKREIYNESNDL